MTLPIIEIILYDAVILLSPVIYIFYLKRRHRISKAEMRQNAIIFGGFYLLIVLVGLVALHSAGWISFRINSNTAP